MGAAYNILGKQVQPQFLALGTIGAVLLAVVPKPWAAAAPKKDLVAAAAGSPEEEKFIREYVEKA